MSNNPKENSVDLSKLTKEKAETQNSTKKSDEKLITKLNESLELIGHESYCLIDVPHNPKKDDTSKND